MSVIVQQTVAGGVYGWSSSGTAGDALTQTFTFTTEADITSIMIYSQRSDAPDGVLRCTFGLTSNQFPYTFDISALVIPASQGWATITFPDPFYFHVNAGAYKFGIRRISGSGLLWRANLADPYAGGVMAGIQYPTPATAIPATWDSMFIVNGDAYPAKPTNPAPADTATSVRLNTALFEWEAGT